MNSNFTVENLRKLSLKAFSVHVYTFMSPFPSISVSGGVK